MKLNDIKESESRLDISALERLYPYEKKDFEYMLKDYELMDKNDFLSQRQYYDLYMGYHSDGVDDMDGEGYYEWLKDWTEDR